jgi:acyl-CoA reductase-like NAD-dependent aldehyde dehydrogenase
MQIWSNEVFGLILAISTFKTEAKAIDMANNSQ